MTGSRLRYAGRRLAQAVPVVLAMVIFNFALLHLAPGSVKRLLHEARAALALMLEDRS